MSMYYRRWTRMHVFPALRYFHQYGALSSIYDVFKPIVYQELPGEVPSKWKPTKKTKIDTLDQKLINTLLTKYPDLKYESIDREKMLDYGTKHNKKNVFSYAYAFINLQKELIKKGFTVEKAFQMAEDEFHSRLAKKLDNSIISRGLAIGNRAKSMMTLYQQQAEYESRLKMLRTKRELEKYQEKLDRIREAVEGPSGALASGESAAEKTGTKNAKEKKIYARTFYQVHENELFPEQFQKDENVGNEDANFANPLQSETEKQSNRYEQIKNFEENVKSVFEQFYQTAASKDRLNGLTDEQLKQELAISPSKIKKDCQALLKKLNKYGVTLKRNGEVDFSKVQNERVRKMLENNDRVKYVLLAAELDYEFPHREYMNQQARQYKKRLRDLEEEKKETALTPEEEETILRNKKKAYKDIQEYDILSEKGTYRLFESYEERLMRMEIKWLRNQIADIEGSVDQMTLDEKISQLDDLVKRFRRAKFRAEQRHLENTQDQTKDPLFSQHLELDRDILKDPMTEYEQLISYLHKKVEERRLSTLDQLNDDKIHDIISMRKIHEEPLAQGFKRSDM